MARDAFIQQIEDLLEMRPGTLHGDERLVDLAEWDSLAVMSFLALADEQYGQTVAPQAIGQAQTVNDLRGLLDVEAAA